MNKKPSLEDKKITQVEPDKVLKKVSDIHEVKGGGCADQKGSNGPSTGTTPSQEPHGNTNTKDLNLTKVDSNKATNKDATGGASNPPEGSKEVTNGSKAQTSDNQTKANVDTGSINNTKDNTKVVVGSGSTEDNAPKATSTDTENTIKGGGGVSGDTSKDNKAATEITNKGYTGGKGGKEGTEPTGVDAKNKDVGADTNKAATKEDGAYNNKGGDPAGAGRDSANNLNSTSKDSVEYDDGASNGGGTVDGGASRTTIKSEEGTTGDGGGVYGGTGNTTIKNSPAKSGESTTNNESTASTEIVKVEDSKVQAPDQGGGPEAESFLTKLYNWITGKNLPPEDPFDSYFGIDGSDSLSPENFKKIQNLFEIREYTDFLNYDGPKDPLFEFWREFFRNPKNLGLPLSPHESEIINRPEPQEFSLIPYEPAPGGSEYNPSGDWFVVGVKPNTNQLDGLDQEIFGDWKIDPTVLEDPEGFYSTILPNLRLLVFKERPLLLKDLFPGFKDGLPSCGLDSTPYVRSILYLEGDDKDYWTNNPCKFTEYDPRISKEYLRTNYTYQCSLPRSDWESFRHSHKWNRCGFEQWDEYWMPDKEWFDFISRTRLYRNKKYRYPFDGLHDFEKRFTAPPRDVEFHSYWITFREPLKSLQPGGPSICGIQVNTLPPRLSMDKKTGHFPPHECNPRLHPNFNKKTNHFNSTDLFAPKTWYGPKWGSRLKNTEINDFLIFLEKAVKLLGDYINKRIGGEMPFWASKDFFMRNFGWARNHPEVLANKHQGRLAPHLVDGLNRLKTKASVDFHARMVEGDFFWTALRLIEETSSALLTTITICLILLISLLKKIWALDIWNWVQAKLSSFKALVLIKKVVLFFVINLKGLVVTFVIVYVLGTSLVLDTILWVIDLFLPFKPAMWAIWCVAIISIHNTIATYLHRWRNLDNKEFTMKDFGDFCEYEGPGFFKRRAFLVMIPIFINIIFGEPFFMSMAYQKLFTVILISLYFLYLFLLSLYLLKCLEGDVAKIIIKFLFPSFERKRTFIKMKLLKDSGLRPSSAYYAANPLIWRIFYRGPRYIKVLIWRLLVLTFIVINIILVLVLACLLCINIEGLVGEPIGAPLGWEGWTKWFLKFSLFK